MKSQKICSNYKMATLFNNSENNKNSDPYRPLLSLNDFTILLIAPTNMIQSFYMYLHKPVQLFAYLLEISRTIFIFHLIQTFHVLS